MNNSAPSLTDKHLGGFPTLLSHYSFFFLIVFVFFSFFSTEDQSNCLPAHSGMEGEIWVDVGITHTEWYEIHWCNKSDMRWDMGLSIKSQRDTWKIKYDSVDF